MITKPPLAILTGKCQQRTRRLRTQASAPDKLWMRQTERTKRLCKPAEWRNACMGPSHTTYGYGNTNEPRRCNDHGRSPVVAMYGNDDLNDPTKWNWERMNQPMLNQLPGTLAHAGDHPDCTNDYGVYDMVGNLHEWVADPKGTFQGGYYQDTQLNGEGCTYKTMAHAVWYHDYSTGFRCCSDVAQ